MFFRTLVFKVFNKISTWQLLEEHLGEVTWRGYDYRAVDRVLAQAFSAGERLYSVSIRPWMGVRRPGGARSPSTPSRPLTPPSAAAPGRRAPRR